MNWVQLGLLRFCDPLFFYALLAAGSEHWQFTRYSLQEYYEDKVWTMKMGTCGLENKYNSE